MYPPEQITTVAAIILANTPEERVTAFKRVYQREKHRLAVNRLLKSYRAAT